jgi:hypothetical protein
VVAAYGLRNDVHSDLHIVPIPGVNISQYCVSSVYQFVSYWFQLMAPSIWSGALVAGRSPLQKDCSSCPPVLMNLDRHNHLPLRLSCGILLSHFFLKFLPIFLLSFLPSTVFLLCFYAFLCPFSSYFCH